jgi:hypothetical protein
MRQHPKELRLVETHPGGGIYDCLSLYDRGDHQRAAIHLNRAGSATVFGSFDNRGTINEMTDDWRSIWPETVAIGDLRRVVSELTMMSGLASVDKLPPSTNETLVFRVMAAILSATGLASTRWECRMGYADTSGIGGGPRSDMFEPFATLSEASERHEKGDFLDEPCYRFWFILRADVPVVGFETTSGTAETANGATHHVMELYRASKGQLWPVVSRVAGAFLP